MFRTAVVSALYFLTTAIQAEDVKEPQRIATAPSAKFYLVRYTDVDEEGSAAGQRLALVSANEPDKRVPLPISGKVETDTTMGLAFISPNEDWIFSVDSLCGARLYRRTSELRYEPAKPECLADGSWHFFVDQEKVDEKLIGMPHFGESRIRAIDFVDWSADSRRLLLSLSTSIGPPDKGSDIFKTGVGAWLCYFNTDTGEFELTERLRAANRDARKRWEEYASGLMSEALPLIAESVGEESAWTPARQRFEHADKRLNEVYALVLKQSQPPTREQLQQEQREWLIQRDAAAAIYANQHWGPFGAAALLEGKALSTEARVAEFEKQLK